jgi:regulatory protein
MTGRPPRRLPPPLEQAKLEELALGYVGRFATSRAKLRTYLARKLRERGWNGNGEPDLHAIAERLTRLGYIDDAAFALSKAQGLTARGYGKRRVVERLRGAGIEEADGAAARDHSEREALASALRYAERRRIGPFAREATSDPRERDKAVAALIRAGHAFALARAIVAMPPGSAFDTDDLASHARLADN